MLLQPTNPTDNHGCSHERVINVSPVGQKDNSLQHQDKSLVSLAPAMVWGSYNPWHLLRSLFLISERFVGNPAECLSFPETLYIGHEKLQPPGFHLVCNWLKKKEGKLADFFQKEKKHSWNNWQGKETHKQVWQDYKSTLPTPVHLFEACDIRKFALYSYAKHAPLAKSEGDIQ